MAREKLGLSHIAAPDVHRHVIEKLYAMDPVKGNLLHRLRHMRNEADYKLHLRIGKHEAQLALKLAEEVLRWLKRWQPGPFG